MEVNAIDRIVIADWMKSRGIEHYTIQPGNNCVWVSYGRVNAYFKIKNSQVVDIIVD